jgi:hypothetical protein
VRRPLVLVPILLVVIAVGLVLARFLTTENRERDHVRDLVGLEARGDAAGVLRSLDGCDATCQAKVRGFVPRLRGAGDVKIIRLDSATSYSLGTDEGWSRVVWSRGATGRPVVQCVRVRRKGGPLGERSISLRRITAPLADNEQSC